MYLVYLENIAFPLAPGKIAMKIKGRNETAELIDGQEITLFKSPGLTEIQFSLLLPAREGFAGAYYPQGYRMAEEYLDAIERFQTGKRPVRLIITRQFPDGEAYFDTNMLVSLEEYSITESAAEGFDLQVDLRLKRWVEYGTRVLQMSETAQGQMVVTEATARESHREMPKRYTVKAGDTLWAICKKELGDGSRYQEIAAKNGIANPTRIYPGQVISFA